jgi:hypothetical protein
MLTTPLLPSDAPAQTTASGAAAGLLGDHERVDEAHVPTSPGIPSTAAGRRGPIAMTAAALRRRQWSGLRRVGNTPARALYEQTGFLPMGVRKQYYPADQGQREDAIVMSLNLCAAGAAARAAAAVQA